MHEDVHTIVEFDVSHATEVRNRSRTISHLMSVLTTCWVSISAASRQISLTACHSLV